MKKIPQLNKMDKEWHDLMKKFSIRKISALVFVSDFSNFDIVFSLCKCRRVYAFSRKFGSLTDETINEQKSFKGRIIAKVLNQAE